MVLVTGATGFVGQKIMQLCKDTVVCPPLRNISEDDLRRMIDESGADTIIHTAAISDIGTCQADPEASYTANVQLPVNLAKAAKGAKLICFSSDQVYSGLDNEGPYSEDTVKAGNLYAEHKLEMERRVLDIAPDAVMLRAEWMYDYYLKKPNYFMNILTATDPLRFSSQQFRGVTYVKEVAENMEAVMTLPGGAYNFGSETTKSMYAVTKEFLEFLGKDLPLEDAPPRHDLWMNCEKAKKFGVVFSSVEDGLKRCAADHQPIREVIDRIQQMERRFDALTAAADPADVKYHLQLLTRYYEGGQWLRDYELDEQGLLPPNLKRGVLSQDGLFDLLEQNNI